MMVTIWEGRARGGGVNPWFSCEDSCSCFPAEQPATEKKGGNGETHDPVDPAKRLEGVERVAVRAAVRVAVERAAKGRGEGSSAGEPADSAQASVHETLGREARGGWQRRGGLVAPRCRRPQLTGARRKKGTHQKTQVRKSHATWDAIEKRNDDVALRKPTR